MKLKRLFFLILGCVCLALGCVGIVLPVLPTVPFFLATVFCFANSSEKLHTWFLGTELYQKHLDSFVKKKGMTAQTKAGILMSVTLLDGRRLFPDAAKSALHSLHYAFTTLNQGGYEDIATEEFENIHNLFAAILAKGIGRQLKQGLYREYLNQKETVTAVRGKIDMPGTIQNRLARRQVLTCEYDELSENNLLNQILKTTVMLLLRHVRVDQAYKSDLKKEMLFFSNIDTVDPGTIHWSAIRFQRNNNTYRMLISLCQLILEGMLLTSDSGEYRLASFIDEQRMNRLYEKFILEYYAKECPQVTATASQIPWALDDGIGTMLPVMQSDIMLTRGNEVLIIDAKYYTHTTQAQYDVHTLHSGNLYQIFTYVKNKAAEFGNEPHQVSGMLLYAATDEAIQPDNRYRMSGNQISVKTLDLNKNFSEISAQLNRIVEDHFL